VITLPVLAAPVMRIPCWSNRLITRPRTVVEPVAILSPLVPAGARFPTSWMIGVPE
jgi:hypothetical protein